MCSSELYRCWWVDFFFYDRRCWPRIYCADVRVELIFPYNPQQECKSTYFLKKNQNIPASGGKYQRCQTEVWTAAR